MKAYINGLGCISPQNSFTGFSLNEPVYYQLSYLKSVEPAYREYLNPLIARRLSRIIKMGMTSAVIALKDAGIEVPGGIITGTGLGCVEDTEKFLSTMIENNETLLNPTNFIQSTYNTISSQIAIMTKCHGYNSTYVNRGFSFESALLDGIMLLDENKLNNVLVGGLDEITENHYIISNHTGAWKKEITSTENLLNSNTKGTVPGEGSAFFLLSNEKTDNTYCCIESVSTLYKPNGYNEVWNAIQKYLAVNKLNINDLDLIILGNNGDAEGDDIYKNIMKSVDNVGLASYKHLCGEYYTSTAFALWMASNIIKTQQIPETIKINKLQKNQLNKVLVYNHYDNREYSLILLSKVN